MPLSNPTLAALDDGRQVFNVTHPLYGDGSDWVLSARAAYNAALAAGGGVVVFPKGTYAMASSGKPAVFLHARDNTRTRGNITIRIDAGAVVQLSATTPRFIDFDKVADYDWFRNLTVSGPGTIDANNVAGKHHVVLGTYQNSGFQDSLNLELIRATGGLRVINVRTDPTGVGARWVFGITPRAKPGDTTIMYIRDIVYEDIHVEGGDLAFMCCAAVADQADAPTMNYRMSNVLFQRLWHDTGVNPAGPTWASGNWFIGMNAYVENAILRDSYGRGAGDCGLEIDNADNCLIENVVCEDSWNCAFLVNNFRVPLHGLATQRVVFRDCKLRFYATSIAQPLGWFIGSNNGVAFGTVEILDCSEYSEVLPAVGNADSILIPQRTVTLAGVATGETKLRVGDVGALSWADTDSVTIGAQTTTLAGAPVNNGDSTYTITLAAGLLADALNGTTVTNTTRSNSSATTGVPAGATKLYVTTGSINFVQLVVGKDVQIGVTANNEWATISAIADKNHVTLSAGLANLHANGALLSMPAPVDRVTIRNFQHVSRNWTYTAAPTNNYNVLVANAQDCLLEIDDFRSKISGTTAGGAGQVNVYPISINGRRLTFDIEGVDTACDLTVGGAANPSFYSIYLGQVSATRPNTLGGRIRKLRPHSHTGFTGAFLAGVLVGQAVSLTPTPYIAVDDCNFTDISGATADVRFQVSPENKDKVHFGGRTFWSTYPPATATISPSGSPFSYQNIDGYREYVTVQSGTVSKIEYSRDNSAFIDVGVTAGFFTVEPSEYLRVTYTVAPTMKKIPQR